ncbi:MAG: acyl-CoA dehydrogenase family protein [Candidatus Dormibacteria bacterium]
MDFTFSEEQDELREQARSFLERRFPSTDLGRLADSDQGWDPSSWQEIADLGWLGVSVEESLGGAQLSFLEEAILIEEFGRRLYCGPFLSTVGLARPAIPRERLAELASGRSRWSVCADSGSALVPDLMSVDQVVVVDGGEVFLAPAAGQALPSIDPTRRMGRLPGGGDRELLATGEAAERLVRDLSRRRLSVLALEAVGLAQQVLEWGVEHAVTREQFQRKIGSYQAVSHPLVDSYVEIELARSLAYWSAWCLAGAVDDLDLAAPAAYSAATEAAVRTCERVIQIQGGMGFTWESALHRYYKRALWIQHFGGAPDRHRAGVARRLMLSSQSGLGAPAPAPDGQPGG